MNYILWAIVAMVSYGITAALLKVALRDYPPEVALVITNLLLVAAGFSLAMYRGASFAAHINLDRPTLLIVLAGLTLSISIISYYTALSRGPASLVVPVYALSFAVTTVLAIAFLGEAVKATRVLGLLMAAGAVVLLTR